MITFKRISQSNFNEVEFNLVGDDITTTLTIDLNLPPFNLSFSTQLPIGVEVTTREEDDGLTATGSIANVNGHAILTITFSSAPVSTSALGPVVVFVYGGL